MVTWRDWFAPQEWAALLWQEEEDGEFQKLEACTYSGKPYGNSGFLARLSGQFGRPLVYRRPGRPRKNTPIGANQTQVAQA
jgi:hypothetical protein